MNASVYDENGQEVYDKVAYLVAKKPCLSFTRGLWKQNDKYIESYWSRFDNVWFHGDWATMSRDGYFFILGRADDVIKVAGKRVGPNEVEDAVLRVKGVRESACVGIPDDIKGESIVVFYMGDKSEDVVNEVGKEIERSLGRSFSPKKVIWVSSLPRTRSGKIMHRLVRSAYLHLPPGDTNNLENPEALDEISATGMGD
ncbi:acetyl-coenzyme A synthetase [mine drainage metagenome]|uniref:acetate--CoA ligase n=1 Tax=mine drainage metagenome TaxID=410659 RepID=T1ARK8_9ZZZZ